MAFVCDYDKLITLMRNFHLITGLKTVVYDHEMQVMAAVPQAECAFCAALNGVEESHRLCTESAASGCRLCKEQQSLRIYRCHAGLIEAVTPIRIGDIIVGYMMLGQVLEQGDLKGHASEIVDYAARYVGDVTASSAFSHLACKSREEIEAAAKIMESCVCDLLMHQVIMEENGKLAFSMARYIAEHLSENLSVDRLCEIFGISRNTLYGIADTYWGMTVARYIKKKRIEKAAELIRNGDTMTQVADRLGFCDYGYFGKVFKAVTGQTPSAVKKSR